MGWTSGFNMVNGDPSFNGGYTRQEEQQVLSEVGFSSSQFGLS
jgi:hypothetical protein